MKAVALKNLIVKTLMNSETIRTLGFKSALVTLEHGRLCVEITGTTFDVLKPGRVEITTGSPFPITTSLNITVSDRTSPEYDYTPEADAMKDAILALVAKTCAEAGNEGIRSWWAMYGAACHKQQGAKMALELARAKDIQPSVAAA